jgi:hypothetical protein
MIVECWLQVKSLGEDMVECPYMGACEFLCSIEEDMSVEGEVPSVQSD